MEVTRSVLRRKVLAYFFTNPESKLYLRELASIIREDPANLSRELSRLEKEGIFVSQKCGNQKFFSLNRRYPLYKELKSIIFKTAGVVGSVRQVLEKVGNVKLAFVYGSFARAKENYLSDIDMVIVGRPDEDELIKHLDRLEERLQREINYRLYTPGELQKESKEKEPFVLEILRGRKVMVIGNESELRKISAG